MAKVRNKRNNGLADKVHNKRKSEANKKKINPFEVHINREKIKVLGKKSKHDKGLPGVSRAKAIQKRKETLGAEMKLMNKTNTFIDRRIGEKNAELSAEDRMIARFAAERTKQHSKKNIYNLADDEVLTHRGQTLEQIEKFDDPRSDEEDDDGMGKGFGGLNDDFVAEGHFGGGMLKTETRDGAKSHKDLIEQLIAESKKRKAEKQKEKEQTLDLTEKLDSEWKDLQPVVFKRQKVEEESLIDKVLSQAEKQGADYDKMMRELRFEKRGTPSDGLKNDEKQAKEEQLKLEQWEKDLRQRMTGEEVKKNPSTKPKHRSAEDLEDNFELEDEKEFMLAYDKEGKPLVPEHILKDYSVPNAKPKYEDGVSDTSDDDDGDDDESDDENQTQDKESNDSDDTEQLEETETAKNGLSNGNRKSSGDNDSSSDNNDDDDKQTTQLNSKKEKLNTKTVETKNTKLPKDDKKQNNVTKVNDLKHKTVETKSILLPNDEGDDDSKDDDSDDDDDEEESDDDSVDDKTSVKDDFKDLQSDESETELDPSEMEYKIKIFFDTKTMEGDNLKELLADKPPAQQSIALYKLIKKYDPSLSEHNKEHLSRLFAHMLQYTNDIFTKNIEGDLLKAFLTFDRLVPYFYDLAKTNKVSTKKYLIELIKEKRDSYMKNIRKIPDLDTLIFFKLVAILYPTSDFRHPVTTPCLIFMSEILTNSKFENAYSISRGMFLTAIILEYTVLSKRLIPSALNFLRGIIYLSANTSILNPIQLVPPFKTNTEKLLKLDNDCSKMAAVNKMALKDLTADEFNDDFKIRTLAIAVRMTKEFFDNFSELESQECLFEAHIKLIGRVDLDNYPKKVNKFVSDIVKDMKDSLEVKTFAPLTLEKKRPKALRLYEPDIQDVFTGNKNSKLSREDADRKRLQVKYKKEMKGALREIRRDKAYVASVKIKQKIQSDNIRKDKVKQIYKDASIQQGELNKLKRGK